MAAVLLVVNSLYSPAHALNLSLRCGFDYDDRRYEWLEGDADVFFQHINEKGQVVVTNGQNGPDQFPRMWFVEAKTTSFQQVTSFLEYSGEYGEYVTIEARGIGEDGEVFGDVFLVTDAGEGNNFREASNQFAFVWDDVAGLREMALFIPSAATRGEVGAQSAIATSPPPARLITERTGEAQTSTPLPFDVRVTQRDLPDAIGDAAANTPECGGSNPIIPVSAFDSPPNNDNFEFFSGDNLIRLAAPRISISVRDNLQRTDENGDVEFDFDGNGFTGDTLGLQIQLENIGVVDVNIESLEVEFTGDSGVFSTLFADSPPQTLAEGERAAEFSHFYGADGAGEVFVRIKVDISDENGETGTFYSRFVNLNIEGEGTTLSIDTDRGRYDTETDEENNQFSQGKVTLQVRSDDVADQNVVFGDPVITVDKEEIIELVLPSEPPSFTVSRSRDPFSINIPFTALKPGVVKLTSSIDVTNTDTGATSTITEEASVVVSPFEVTVTVKPDNFKVNDTPREDLTQACRDYERPEPVNPDPNDPPFNPEVANCLEIEVVVKNISEDTITNVASLDVDDITRAISSLDPEVIEKPVRHLTYIAPMDEEGNPLVPTLTAGESQTHRFLFEAFGGSPRLEARPVFRGTLNGEEIQGSGTDEFKLVEDVILRFGAQVRDPSRPRIAGAPFPIEAFMENFSETNWIVATVFPIVSDNAGRGHLYNPEERTIQVTTFDTNDCHAFAEIDAGKLPEIFPAIMIPPKDPDSDDPSRVDLDGVLATMCWEVDSRAKVNYVIEAYTLETDEDGNRETVTRDGAEVFVQKDRLVDQVEYVTDDGYHYKFDLPVRGNPNVNVTDSFCDELDWLDQYLACEAARGVHSFGTGLVELPGFLWDGTKYVVTTDLHYGARLMHWSANQLVVGYDAFFGDTDESKEAARAKLRAEVDLVLFSLERGAIITAEQSDQIGEAAVTTIDGIVTDFRNGDYRQIGGRTAFAVGDNIDAIITGGVVKTIAGRIQKGFRVTKIGEVRDIERAVGDGIEQISTRRSQTEVDNLAREVTGRDVDILTSGDLKPNDPLSYDFLTRYVGVPRETVQKIEAIVQKYKIQVSFRSRGIGAIQKLRDGLAYWKPMPIKQKNVNGIDIEYLGYPPQARDLVLIVEPPIKASLNIDTTQKGWSRSEAFNRQLDQWMRENTTIAKPDGLDALDARLASDSKLSMDEFELPDSFDEYVQVRERLRTRVEEWEKYTTDNDLFGPDLMSGRMLTEGINMRFGYKEQGLSSFFDFIAPKDNVLGDTRRIMLEEGFRLDDGTIINDVDGRRIFDLTLDGPGGFKRITGDIDFLTILDHTGALIKNPVRRFFIYLELANAVGMQHGETFSFIFANARAGFLEAHVLGRRGSEALATISHHSDGTARRRAGYFVRNRAIVEDLGNGVTQLDIKQQFVPLTTAGHALKTSQDVVEKLLDPGTYFTRLSDILDRYTQSVWPLRQISNAVGDVEESDVAPDFSGDVDAPDARVVQPRGGDLNSLESVPPVGNQLFVPVGEQPRVLRSNGIDQVALAWVPIPSATAKNSDGLIASLPYSVLEAPASADTDSLTIASRETMGATGNSPFFAVGQTIVLDPTGELEETAVVASVDPLTLTAPLLEDHDTGTAVVVVPERLLATDNGGGGEISDSDGDGVADSEDTFPNDPNESADTDSDGIGNNADTDDDGDGSSDEDEVRFNSDPLDASDTPADHRPAQPSVIAANFDPMAPLTQIDLDVTAFSDPDESGAADVTNVQITGPLDDGSIGIVFNGEVTSVTPLTLPDALLDIATDYELYLRYIDATGQASDYSEPVPLSTAASNPDDADGNAIDDSAELADVVDINNNGTPDADEGITGFAEANSGAPMGIAASAGSVTNLSTATAGELPLAVNDDLPFGMVGFRVDDVEVGASVDVTFYLPNPTQGNQRWLQFDPNASDLIDLTAQAVFDGDRVIVTYVDGGAGDLDGVANGRIVDPSGPSAVVCEGGVCETASEGRRNIDQRCFVATSLFGGSARETNALRAFRDDYLKGNAAGEAFIAWYYGNSPGWVQWSADKPVVTAVARFMLEPLAEAAALASGKPAELPAPQLALIALLLIWRRQRRQRQQGLPLAA